MLMDLIESVPSVSAWVIVKRTISICWRSWHKTKYWQDKNQVFFSQPLYISLLPNTLGKKWIFTLDRSEPSSEEASIRIKHIATRYCSLSPTYDEYSGIVCSRGTHQSNRSVCYEINSSRVLTSQLSLNAGVSTTVHLSTRSPHGLLNTLGVGQFMTWALPALVWFLAFGFNEYFANESYVLT